MYKYYLIEFISIPKWNKGTPKLPVMQHFISKWESYRFSGNCRPDIDGACKLPESIRKNSVDGKIMAFYGVRYTPDRAGAPITASVNFPKVLDSALQGLSSWHNGKNHLKISLKGKFQRDDIEMLIRKFDEYSKRTSTGIDYTPVW